MPVLTKINTNVIADNAVTSAKIPADAVIASDIAAGAVGISELASDTGVTSTYHKVPTFANDAARNTAIPSPVVGMLVYNTASGAVQQYNGTWSTIAPAPNVTALSGFLNDDTDSTITVFGTNFTTSSSVKMFTAASGGSQIGSNATTTFVSNTILKAVFGAGSIGASGSTAYIEVDNAGATNRFATAITVNADPTVTHAGATGTSSNTTTHLGTYGGIVAGGGGDSNTKLLLNFDRGGGTDFEDSSNTGGDGSKFGAGYDAIIKASPFGDGKSAMLFDGSDDKLVIADHADWDLPTTSTIDFWVNFNNLSGSVEGLISKGGAGQTTDYDGWGIWYSSGALKVRVRTDGTSTDLSTGIALTLNTWHHICWARNGTTSRIYVNGTQFVSSTTAGGLVATDTDSTNPLEIGKSTDGHSGSFTSGYYDEIRISHIDRTASGQDLAVTGSTFTVPTTRYSSDSDTKLLIHSNLSTGGSSYNTFTDSATTGTTHTITATGSFHSTLYNVAENTVTVPALTWPASGKTFGSFGMFFDGARDNINTVDGVAAGSGVFTYDLWVYPLTQVASGSDDITIFDTRDAGNASNGLALFYVKASRTIRLYIEVGNSDVTFSQTALTLNAWNHLALERYSSTIKFFVGGVQDTSTTITSNTANLTSDDLRLGMPWNYNINQSFKGYIDVFRYSSSARYSGANFTPETKVYGAVESATVPTITFTGTATQLAADEDIEFTAVTNQTKAANNQKLTDSGIGLVLTNLTGGDKNKATLTGTIASPAATTHTNMAVKAQVRKTLSENTYNNSTTVTFTGSTTTAGLAPGMPLTGTGISVAGPLTCGLTNTSTTVTAVSTTGLVVGMQVNAFTGVPAGATIASIITNTSFVISSAATATDADAILTFNTIIASVDSATVITLSNTTTSGAQTDNDLIFEDLTRVAHVNGTEVFDGTQAMMTIATGTGAAPVLFQARRYIGNATYREITGFGFQPDMVWFKTRNDDENHHLQDSVRGATNRLYPARTTMGGTDVQSLLSFNNDGVTLGTTNQVNKNATKMIAWGWKAGGAPSSSALSIDGDGFGAGTIADDATGVVRATNISQSVNQTGGFSITQFLGHSSGVSWPHNLGGTPDFIIVKAYDVSTYNWYIWHKNLTSTTGYWIYLNTNAAQTNDATGWSPAPTSTVISSGTRNGIGAGVANHMCYAWKAVAGVSAFGTYVGADGGTRVYTTLDGTSGGTGGFRPKWIMTKSFTNTSDYTSWAIYDAFRDGNWGTSGTVALTTPTAVIYADQEKVEGQRAGATSAPSSDVTIYDDGFKFSAANDETNSHAAWGYIYCAFA